jgi:hypothetical protein
MTKRPYAITAFLITSFFVLACYSSSLSVLSTRTPSPTLASIPNVPTLSIQSTQLSDQPAGGLENENLLAVLPEGFEVDYQAEQNNQTITEMVPEGETVEDWSNMVTVQVYLGEKSITPQQVQETLTSSWFNACENSETYPVADGTENGYNFVLWQLYCPVNPSTGKVEYTYMKAIAGNDSFYLVQIAFRYEPTEADITQWMQYLKKVLVCDSRIPEQACP